MPITREAQAHNEALAQFERQLPFFFDPANVTDSSVRWEAAILQILNGMALYANCHRARYGDPIGDDGVFGEVMSDMVWSVKQLLSGELGRLRGGMVTTMLREFCQHNNVDYKE